MLKRRPSTHFATPHSAALRWPRRTGLPSVFTAFVRYGLRGERTPDADLFHDAWHGLRAALVCEMKRRGLWQSPPSYLGAYGWESWDSEASQGALGELVADCYAFIFVDRLQSLQRQLQEKPDIDGLVLLNVRHFLHERQRAHDPLGFRIFEMMQAAVEVVVSSGALHVLAGDRKIRNDTCLGFDPGAELPSTPLDLEPVVRLWNDELMPELVTARTRQQAAVVRRLRELLLELPRCGIEAFRFKDLLDPLKRDARERWAALQAPEPPEDADDSRESFEHLTRCISTSIDRVETDARTRTQLRTLWRYLWRQQEDEGPEAGGAGPSYRQLGQRLKIPRERLPVLFALLRQIVRR